MKPSPLKHTLAILRYTIGRDMTQKEMARLIKRSPVTIQKIELCKLPLTETLGLEVAMRTGVDFDWLMKNDVNAPIINAHGDPYTREMFERAQSVKPNDTAVLVHAYYHMPMIIAGCLMKIGRAALAAQASNDPRAFSLFGYRITKAIENVVEPIDGFDEVFNNWVDQLQAAMRSKDPGNDCYKLVHHVLQDCSRTSNEILEAKTRRPLPRRTAGSRSTPARSSRKTRRA